MKIEIRAPINPLIVFVVKTKGIVTPFLEKNEN